MSKIGLVVEGGGMKCAYSAGILDKFIDDNITFDYVIGVSAGSANALSYLAGQKGRNIRFYTKHIHDDGYMGFKNYLKNGEMFGLDYIYTDLTNSDGGDPLDYEKIMENPAEYELVATNALTGMPEYFSKEVFVKDDYEHVKASCAIPAACKPRYINGVPYFDGGVSDAIPHKHAFEMGCDKVIIITSKPRDFVRKPESMRRLYSVKCRKFPNIVAQLDTHHDPYNKSFQEMFKLEKEGKAIVLAPSKPLDISTFTCDEEKNWDIYNLGISDYYDKKDEILEFLKI